jgi:ParB family chromosome partitioning protein
VNGIDRMKASLGAHIKESMGAAGTTGAGGMTPPPAGAGPAQYQGCTRPKDTLTIEVSRLMPDPEQPRKEFDRDALEHLARSLKARGQLQPIRVRWAASRGGWIIVSGERRWRAASLAGLATLACVEVKGEPTPDEILEDQLVENCVREDLKPIEQARAFKALLERRGCSGRQLAESLNISHMAVTRALALLALPATVQDQVEQGALAPATAYEVSKAEPSAQEELAREVVAGKLTREEAVEAVRRSAGRKGRGPAKGRKATSRVFRTAAGPRVTIEHRKGLDAEAMAAALREVLGQLEATLGAEGQQAA